MAELEINVPPFAVVSLSVATWFHTTWIGGTVPRIYMYKSVKPTVLTWLWITMWVGSHAGRRSRRKKAAVHRPSSRSYEQTWYNTSDVDISTATDTAMLHVSQTAQRTTSKSQPHCCWKLKSLTRICARIDVTAYRVVGQTLVPAAAVVKLPYIRTEFHCNT